MRPANLHEGAFADDEADRTDVPKCSGQVQGVRAEAHVPHRQPAVVQDQVRTSLHPELAER